MTQKKSLRGKQTKLEVPPLHEEPIRGAEPNKIACLICGKTFKAHSERDRHMEQAHGNPEKTHI